MTTWAKHVKMMQTKVLRTRVRISPGPLRGCNDYRKKDASIYRSIKESGFIEGGLPGSKKMDLVFNVVVMI